MSPDSPPDVTRLLQAWSDGDAAAPDQLFSAIYSDLHPQAERYMRAQSPGHTLQATALVHEAYIRLAGGEPVDWKNRAPWRRAFLGYAYAGLGRRADAAREGLEAEKMVPASTDPMQRALVTFAIARIYAFVGDRDAAIERLEYLMSIPSMVSAPLLRVDPTWASLRGNPRFRRLLQAEASFATPDSS